MNLLFPQILPDADFITAEGAASAENKCSFHNGVIVKGFSSKQKGSHSEGLPNESKVK